MKSAELATEVEKIVKEAQSRITGIGAEQYAHPDNTQKFERMHLTDLFEYMEEELLDQINYSVMNLLRVRLLKKAVIAVSYEVNTPFILSEISASALTNLRMAIHGLPTPQPVERD